MLTQDELEAAVLGAAWVARRGDPALARGARDLIAKIAQSVPEAIAPGPARPVLAADVARPVSEERFDAAILRRALRDRLKVVITYRNGDGTATQRTIWPTLIAYMEEIRIVAAWCELRRDFRHFRTDRIGSIEVTAERIPERRAVLLKRWKASQNLSGLDEGEVPAKRRCNERTLRSVVRFVPRRGGEPNAGAKFMTTKTAVASLVLASALSSALATSPPPVR